MKLLLIAITFISISISAQEKEKKQQSLPKIDTIKMHKLDLSKNKLNDLKDQQRNLYRMPNSKPRDTSAYSSIKSKKKNTIDYKILNSIPVENQKK